ncbi:MAG TPA: GxxExxY protein [Bacteroidales bacterium]|nr:GxxExxY protein [Bacteroidales bacterium]HRX98429.1 GxxExxY protein [Bacteroidales bacterium]
MIELLFKKESYEIVGACMDVHSQLGPGFLESVYQEALAREFAERNIPFLEQWGIDVYYKGEKLEKKFFADFICYGEIIIEIKAMEGFAPEHEAQLINYLKATQKPLGLLINFGAEKLQYRRFANTK